MMPNVSLKRWLTGLIGLVWLALYSHGLALDFPLRWRWSNPTPHGGNVFDMAYGFGLTVQVCERGQIYTSDDLVTWIPQESGTTNSLRGVTFFNDRLVVTGEKGTVLYADALDNFQLVQLNTSDWLESVAASSDTLVAVGDNGAIYTSTNGAAWLRQTVPFTNWLRSVAYGNNTFVAVGEAGFIAKRGNNGTWTGSSYTNRHLNKVAFIENQFRVVGDGGVCLVGTAGGQNWAAVSGIGTTNALYALAGTNTSMLLAGEKEVRLQENGGSWSNQTATNLSFPAPAWTYYDALWQGSLYFVAGRSGMMIEGFKTNSSPTTWVDRFEPIRNWLWDVISLTNLYVAVGDHGTIMTSSDGVDWDLELVPGAFLNTVFLGVGGSSNGLVAVGNRGAIAFSPQASVTVVSTNSVGTILTNQASSLGIDWRAATAVTTNDLQGVALFGNLYVACGGRGTILTSPNGTNWTTRVSPTTVFLSSIVSFPGGLVATGDNGVILTSTNATNWVVRGAGLTTNWLYRVSYLNGSLLAVGENGVILASTNGINWAARSSGTARWLNAATYVAGNYFVAGNQGTILASANGVNWTNIGTITQKSLYGIASNGEQLVTAGIEGAILRTSVVPMLEAPKLLNYSRGSNQNVILISGKTDQRVEIQHSPNLVDWTNSVTLEIVDRSGTLLFLENADTNALPQDFIRARLVP